MSLKISEKNKEKEGIIIDCPCQRCVNVNIDVNKFPCSECWNNGLKTGKFEHLRKQEN